MAKISTYPQVSPPNLSDMLIGTDSQDSNATKNFTVGEVLSLVNDTSILTGFIPYTGAANNVDLTPFGITAAFGNFGTLSVQGEQAFVYGKFTNMNIQSGITVDTPEPVKFTTLITSDGINIASDTIFTVDYEGVYVINLNARAVHSSGGGDGQLSFWIKKLGVDIPYSRQVYTIPNTHVQEINYSFMIRVSTSEDVEIYWTTSNLNVQLESAAASGTYPESPSSIVNIYKVAI